MNHAISVDEQTYQTIKKLAYNEGRTVSGQLRVAINEYAAMVDKRYNQQHDQQPDQQHVSASSYNLFNPMAPVDDRPKNETAKPMSKEMVEILKLENQLDEMDEGSEEYVETLSKIQELQKNSLTR